MPSSSGRVGVVVLANLVPDARFRAFGHLAMGPWRLMGVEGLRFVRVLGSGRGGGFRPFPSMTHQGLFCAFDDDETASRFLDNRSGLLGSFRDHAREFLTVKLKAVSVRGSWGGKVPFGISSDGEEGGGVAGGPVASLTRASIRPSKALQFWQHAGPSEDDLRTHPGCIVAAGLGEMPYLRQATFTIWESEAAMARFARNGAHLAAIRETHARGLFSESMFARFTPYDMRGTWGGRRFD